MVLPHFAWCQQLALDEVASMAALLEGSVAWPAYVTPLLSLAFLAPDIVDRILGLWILGLRPAQ